MLKFSNILPVFWKITPMPLLSRIGPAFHILLHLLQKRKYNQHFDAIFKICTMKQMLNFPLLPLFEQNQMSAWNKTFPNLNNLIDWQCNPQSCSQKNKFYVLRICNIQWSIFHAFNKLQIINFQFLFQCQIRFRKNNPHKFC